MLGGNLGSLLYGDVSLMTSQKVYVPFLICTRFVISLIGFRISVLNIPVPGFCLLFTLINLFICNFPCLKLEITVCLSGFHCQFIQGH